MRHVLLVSALCLAALAACKREPAPPDKPTTDQAIDAVAPGNAAADLTEATAPHQAPDIALEVATVGLAVWRRLEVDELRATPAPTSPPGWSMHMPNLHTSSAWSASMHREQLHSQHLQA